MPKYPNQQSNPAAAIPVWIAANAGSAVIPAPPTPPPSTIVASGSWNSGVMLANGANRLAAAVTSSQNGVLTIQRYIDAAGTIPIGIAPTQAITANTLAWTWVNDGMPFLSWRVTVTNTGGSTANLTNVALLQTI
jgi:hypothetical protein